MTQPEHTHFLRIVPSVPVIQFTDYHEELPHVDNPFLYSINIVLALMWIGVLAVWVIR